MIRKCKQGDAKEGKPWCLYTHDGSKLLGTHPSKESAVKQEQAIKAQAHLLAARKCLAQVESDNITRDLAALLDKKLQPYRDSFTDDGNWYPETNWTSITVSVDGDNVLIEFIITEIDYETSGVINVTIDYVLPEESDEDSPMVWVSAGGDVPSFSNPGGPYEPVYIGPTEMSFEDEFPAAESLDATADNIIKTLETQGVMYAWGPE